MKLTYYERLHFKRFKIDGTVRTVKYGLLTITDVCRGCRLVWANNEKYRFLFKVSLAGRIIEPVWRVKKDIKS